MTPICVRCGRPTLDGYACSGCADRAAGQLAEIVDMTPAARDIATGQARHGGTGGGGKPGSRLPLDLGATAKLDAVQAELGTWLRHVVEERGIHPPHLPHGFDVIPHGARFLAGQVEWFRHREEVDEFLTDVEACARVVRGLVRGPAPQQYLGPCGAVLPFDTGKGCEVKGSGGWCVADEDCRGHCPYAQNPHDAICDGEVYAREAAQNGRCRVCEAEWSTAERKAWLDGEVRSHAYTVAEIADAYPIKANTIRQWLSRGLLVAHGELGGRPLLNLGDVLDLAAGDAARREEARAKRERRRARDGATA